MSENRKQLQFKKKKRSPVCRLVHPETLSSEFSFPICFMHSRLALYCGHMVTFTLIANISQTALELQSAFLAALISKPADLRSARAPERVQI